MLDIAVIYVALSYEIYVMMEHIPVGYYKVSYVVVALYFVRISVVVAIFHGFASVCFMLGLYIVSYCGRC